MNTYWTMMATGIGILLSSGAGFSIGLPAVANFTQQQQTLLVIIGIGLILLAQRRKRK